MLWIKGWVSQRPSSYQPLQLNDFEQIESDCGVLSQPFDGVLGLGSVAGRVGFEIGLQTGDMPLS
jgi:hypothetical protein